VAAYVTVDLAVEPAKLPEFLAFVKELLPDTRAYDGIRSIDVLVDEGNPGHVVFFEIWESRPHYDRYLAWRTETGALANMGNYLTAPPAISHFQRADV
jgi:quinol monooxygenase YgiN